MIASMLGLSTCGSRQCAFVLRILLAYWESMTSASCTLPMSALLNLTCHKTARYYFILYLMGLKGTPDLKGPPESGKSPNLISSRQPPGHRLGTGGGGVGIGDH